MPRNHRNKQINSTLTIMLVFAVAAFAAGFYSGIGHREDAYNRGTRDGLKQVRFLVEKECQEIKAVMVK